MPSALPGTPSVRSSAAELASRLVTPRLAFEYRVPSGCEVRPHPALLGSFAASVCSVEPSWATVSLLENRCSGLPEYPHSSTQRSPSKAEAMPPRLTGELAYRVCENPAGSGLKLWPRARTPLAVASTMAVMPPPMHATTTRRWRRMADILNESL